MAKATKTSPIPVRFEADQDAQLTALQERTGLPKSELVRRAIKMLLEENARRPGPGWIIDELSPMPRNVTRYRPEQQDHPSKVAEDPARKKPPPGKTKAG